MGKIRAFFLWIWAWHGRHKYKLLLLYAFLLTAYYFCLPARLFDAPFSTVLFDKRGRLLGAKIAKDGQWRFPQLDTVPHKFKTAILAFEDKRFYSHWGVDISALGRAIWNNATGHKMSGASTLTMQVMRLSRGNPSRTIVEKIKEIVLATRVEWSYSKDEILLMYAAHAPFGGNVVGLETAAWKYFSRPASQLSWAESAMLAVLPNSPSLIHISRNRSALMDKRNMLLQRLYSQGSIDSLTCALSQIEPLPDAPPPLPMLAPHLLERVHWANLNNKENLDGKNSICNSSLDADIQAQVTNILVRHYDYLSNNEIHNAAALVIDVETNDILAYVGNIPDPSKEHQGDVDIIPARRSSGSILKPFLYAAMLSDGEMLPQQLYPDVPTHFKGYTPKNYDGGYSGAVPAQVMIARSLNVPAIYMLNQYGVMRFLHKLQQVGMTSLDKGADHYGLTLILGGAECSLWDLASMYAGMARSLKFYRRYNGLYDNCAYAPIHFLAKDAITEANALDKSRLEASTPLRASAIWHTFEAMQEVARPGDENFWRSFTTSNRIAWKTGTSFGFRDAWAVGCTPRYVVAVWAGNANGEGRPGLVGVKAAAPILFDIFSALSASGGGRQWFERPLDDMQALRICRQSGHIANEYCQQVDTLQICASGQKVAPCPYHQKIFLSKDKQTRVHSDCESPLNMAVDTFFVLPPAQEWFFKKYHLLDKIVPPYRLDCQATAPNATRRSLAFLSPSQQDLKIYVPTDLDEEKSRVVFEAVHKGAASSLLYWHLDDEYVGSTHEFHQLGLNPKAGKHTITIVSEEGESLTCRFEVVGKE